jgi:hypothetical protein
LLTAGLALIPLASLPVSPSAAARPDLKPSGWRELVPQAWTSDFSHAAPRVGPRVGSGSFVNDGGFENESPNPAWTQVSNGGRQLVDTAHPHSGAYSADLCQSANSCQDIVYQGFTVPARVLSANLTFWFQVQTSASIVPPSPCNDFVGAGIGDSAFHVVASSAAKFCEDWGALNGYYSFSINETSFLQAHQLQQVYIEGVGFTDASAPSRFWIDDYALTITYATPPGQVVGLIAEPNNTSVTLRWQPPADDGGAAITGYQVSAFKNGSSIAGAVFNSPTTTEVMRNLPNGASYTFQVAAQNGAGLGALSALSNPVVPSPAYPAVAVSDRQYSLANSDGSTWVDMDGSNLVVSVTPLVDSDALISVNADLWTANAGINQDIGVAVSGGAFPTAPGQPEAWKESGGFAGTFSPNAAYVQTVRLLRAATPYAIKVQWKTNKAAAGATIFAGAGPIGPDFSPTRLSVLLLPHAGGLVSTATSVSQFQLSNSNGISWSDLGPTADPTLTYTPPANGSLVVSGNADLWTANAAFNQDLGVAVAGGTGVGTTYPTVAGQPEAWKESGGFAGTFSPNAALVQAVLPVVGGSPYTMKLQWKTNRSGPSTIFAGAGPIGGQYSATRLSVFFIPATGATSVQDAVSTAQMQLPANNGASWTDVDATNLSLSISTTADCLAILSGNADLWTARAGYNQDLGIQVSTAGIVTADRVGWKESGGFAGTYSPNAAFIQTMFPIAANTAHTVRLQWKANKAAPVGTIYAGAGPIGGHFSPTRLTAAVLCVPPPVITSITPTSGYSGTPVTVNGSGLTGATISFGTQAAFVQSAGDTQLIVYPPTQPLGTSVDVTATTSGGTSPVVPAAHFTYSYLGAIRADAPNIYYRLGESSGTVATDSSGNGHDGAYSASGVTYATAGAILNDSDTAITLDGALGSIQESSGSGLPVGAGTRSVEAWFKTTSATEMPIVGWGTPGIADQYFGVYVYGTVIEIKTGNGVIVSFPSLPATPLNDGKWHHLVVTYDTGPGGLKVYLDGANFGTQTPSAVLNTTLDAAGLTIGAASAPSPTYFAGSLDEVAIYSSALATYQVSNHYQAGKGT